MRIIAGEFKGRTLKSTTGPGFRPAMGKVREALFSILEARGLVFEGCRALDLFAGGGSLGFEALSRGAERVVFVEKAAYAVKVLEANAALLGLAPERAGIIQGDVLKALAGPPERPFDLVFIDPPYELRVFDKVLQALMKHGWVRSGGLVNAEALTKAAFDPARAHDALECLADREYGQTRVIVWRAR